MPRTASWRSVRDSRSSSVPLIAAGGRSRHRCSLPCGAPSRAAPRRPCAPVRGAASSRVPVRPSDHRPGRRRSGRRAGAEEGLSTTSRPRTPASSGTSGRSRAAARNGIGCARAAMASGEPVGLVMIDGLFSSSVGARRAAGGPRRRSRGWPTCSRGCRSSSISAGVGEAAHASLSPRPDPRRPDHGPVLQQGAARPGGSRASEDDRGPQGDGGAVGGARRRAARPLLR